MHPPSVRYAYHRAVYQTLLVVFIEFGCKCGASAIVVQYQSGDNDKEKDLAENFMALVL